MNNSKKVKYAGQKIDVHWDGSLCIHIGECGRAKGELFTAGRQPWCQPDQVSSENVEDVVLRCPTGALTYQYKDGSGPEKADSKNSVHVVYNGPLYFNGDLDIAGTESGGSGIKFRAALCRCGQSKNKPFCDNSHEEANFRDYAAVGESGETLENVGGELSVNPMPDGPLLVKGNLTITAGTGRTAWQGTKVALCRCGASANKPFCDGKHKTSGFKS